MTTTEAIFDAGYAMPLYGLYEYSWLYRGKIIAKLPFDAVILHRLPDMYADGYGLALAKLDDVLEADKQRNAAISSRDSVN